MNIENRKEPFDFLNEEQKENLVMDIILLSAFYVEKASNLLGIPMEEKEKFAIGNFVSTLTRLIDGRSMEERANYIQNEIKELRQKESGVIKEFFKKGM